MLTLDFIMTDEYLKFGKKRKFARTDIIEWANVVSHWNDDEERVVTTFFHEGTIAAESKEPHDVNEKKKCKFLISLTALMS